MTLALPVIDLSAAVAGKGISVPLPGNANHITGLLVTNDSPYTLNWVDAARYQAAYTIDWIPLERGRQALTVIPLSLIQPVNAPSVSIAATAYYDGDGGPVGGYPVNIGKLVANQQAQVALGVPFVAAADGIVHRSPLFILPPGTHAIGISLVNSGGTIPQAAVYGSSDLTFYGQGVGGNGGTPTPIYVPVISGLSTGILVDVVAGGGGVITMVAVAILDTEAVAAIQPPGTAYAITNFPGGGGIYVQPYGASVFPVSPGTGTIWQTSTTKEPTSLTVSSDAAIAAGAVVALLANLGAGSSYQLLGIDWNAPPPATVTRLELQDTAGNVIALRRNDISGPHYTDLNHFIPGGNRGVQLKNAAGAATTYSVTLFYRIV